MEDILQECFPPKSKGSQCRLDFSAHMSYFGIAPGLDYYRPFDLAVVAPDDVWIVGEEGLLVHYTQGQLEGVEVSEGYDLRLIAMLNSAEGWAAGEARRGYAPENTLLHYQQGEWTVIPLPGDPQRTYDFKDIALVNEREAWLVGDAIFHYQNGNWQEIPGILEEDVVMTGIDMVSETEGWATTNQPYLLHYQQGQWQQVASPTENTLRAIEMMSAEAGWAVGDISTVLHYDQGTWEVVSEGKKPPSLSDIDWVEDEGWAVGVNGKILHYQDSEWHPVNSPLDPSLGLLLEAVDMVNPDEGWAVGWDGLIIHYAQNQWQPVPSPVTQSFNDLDMIDENEGWAGLRFQPSSQESRCFGCYLENLMTGTVALQVETPLTFQYGLIRDVPGGTAISSSLSERNIFQQTELMLNFWS